MKQTFGPTKNALQKPFSRTSGAPRATSSRRRRISASCWRAFAARRASPRSAKRRTGRAVPGSARETADQIEMGRL